MFIWVLNPDSIINTLTVRMVLAVKTFFGFGRYERFTNPKSKHITTDTIHCIHVTNNGASNLTVSPLKSALFTKTVTIDTILHAVNWKSVGKKRESERKL